MQRTRDSGEHVPVSEMAIVDTFTKLIFGDEDGYSANELMIIQAFRSVDDNVLRDSHRDMGEYLRNLGVREMIQVVARVRQFMLEGGEAVGLSEGVRLKPRPLARRIR